MNLKNLTKILSVFAFVFVMSVFLADSSSAQQLAQINLIPSAPSVSNGQAVNVDVFVDTGIEPVNAVQINILYPSESLTFNRVDTKGSAFDLQVEGKAQNGIIKIVRGVVKPVSGSQKVVTLEFVAKGTVAMDQVRVSQDSAIVRTSDSKNIYSGSQTYYSNNSVNNSGTSMTGTYSVPTDNGNTNAPVVATEKKSFFQKIVELNNSFWEAIIGLLTRD